MGDSQNQALREKLTAYENFLVESDFVRGRQRVFKFASTNKTPSFQKDKLQQVSENLHCAAKVKLALGVVPRNVENAN